MAGLNKLIIIGNLGRDPEMRYMPSGSPVTSFSVAVSRRYTTRDGEQKEETEWFNVSCFDRLAETANQYLSKGKQVYIEGRIHARLYDDQSGEKRVSLDVRATEMQMLGQRGDQEFGGDRSFGGQQPAASRVPADSSDFDNMPF